MTTNGTITVDSNSSDTNWDWANGNIGIGITSPDYVWNLNSGNVGIGNSPPNYNLTVQTETINIIVDDDDDSLSSLLSLCYKEIKNNHIVFNVFIDYDKKEPNPIEDVMRMIRKKQVFDFTLTRCGYNLDVKEARFINIKNLIETSANQYIEVEFISNNVEYNNTLKSDVEKRSEKLDLLKQKITKK